MGRSTPSLATFTSRLLEQAGAVIAPLAPDVLEVVAPPLVQAALGVGELAHLGFGPDLPAGAERVGLDTVWLERLGRVLEDHGRGGRVLLEAPVPRRAEVEPLVAKAVHLQNAIYRLADAEPTYTRTWLVALRVTARSDDRRESLLCLGVNLANGSPLDTSAGRLHAAAIADGARPAGNVAGLPSPWTAARLARWLARGVVPRVRAEIAPFVDGLGRRLERDLARLERYHGDLAREASQRAGRAGGDPQRATSKLEAIEREHRAKVADLERRYAVAVSIETLQVVEVVVPVLRLHLLLRRRKGERRFGLDYDAVTRELQPLPCEATDGPDGPRKLCDESLHIVAPAALAACPGCGRERCHACQPARCPRCGDTAEVSAGADA
jgi:hypothetical protein